METFRLFIVQIIFSLQKQFKYQQFKYQQFDGYSGNLPEESYFFIGVCGIIVSIYFMTKML